MAWIDTILLYVLKGMFMLFLCLSSMIWGRVKAQAISHPPLTVETPVQSHISLRGIFGEQNVRDRVFPKYFGVTLLASCHHYSIHTHSCIRDFSN